MTTKTSRSLAALITAVVALSALAGCTPDPEPVTPTSSTPTPEESVVGVPAPESESEAIDNAERTIATYLKVRGEINAAGGTDTTPLEELATGPALQLALDDAGRVVELGWKTEGALSFEPQSAYAVDLVAEDGTAYPYSSANVTGCQDLSEYKIFNSDGTPAQQPADKRAILEFNVIWEPSLKLWLVNSVVVPGQTC